MSTNERPAKPTVSEVLADPVSQELLHSPLLARLAYTASDGSPQVVPIGYLWKDGQFIICTLPNAPKTRALRRDPRVALSMEGSGMNPMGLREYLVVHGTARIVEGGGPELLQRLARVYLGPDVKFPPMDDPPPGVVAHVVPERLGGVGPWA